MNDNQVYIRKLVCIPFWLPSKVFFRHESKAYNDEVEKHVFVQLIPRIVCFSLMFLKVRGNVTS